MSKLLEVTTMSASEGVEDAWGDECEPSPTWMHLLYQTYVGIPVRVSTDTGVRSVAADAVRVVCSHHLLGSLQVCSLVCLLTWHLTSLAQIVGAQ